MSETMPQTSPTEPSQPGNAWPADVSPAELVRSTLCPLCWAAPARNCTVSGRAGDHLARYVAAVKLGLLSRDELAAVVVGLAEIADHVVILGRAA